jgi:hypothetical protein
MKGEGRGLNPSLPITRLKRRRVTLRILVPNLGSTSLKYQLLETEGEKVLARGKIERIGSAESPVTTWDAGSEREVKEVLEVPDHRAAVKILLNKLAHLSTPWVSKPCMVARAIAEVFRSMMNCSLP